MEELLLDLLLEDEVMFDLYEPEPLTWYERFWFTRFFLP